MPVRSSRSLPCPIPQHTHTHTYTHTHVVRASMLLRRLTEELRSPVAHLWMSANVRDLHQAQRPRASVRIGPHSLLLLLLPDIMLVSCAADSKHGVTNTSISFWMRLEVAWSLARLLDA